MGGRAAVPVVVLDFARKRVEVFRPGQREGLRELKKALLAQKRLRPTASGTVPPVKGP